ncbi:MULTISPECIES: ribbon-helix-helix protein, CopG family [unclassified Curtobacterium]|uniref:ribbon-helix-helix protein, CopG family n=1 Tax=unclassified Curtobacterium TaxID=257496 RepID=UPI000DAA057A|nr:MULTISPECIES: ribbon-helix-helix protein, CopG family [unclassified Curtobacterium]PZE27235.1 CopG family transcriptional regulator [Curtobacterium sp. MCBD17_028]PZF60249.1 CopG family transcriptional regulator [Curtobacterium sp. MCBD17_034]PZM34934.1 CopG family transcriptional regulator [Curtobacterium sp. MCBD17_031]WIE54329.1 ribbon-helix-helix protein, CopG family [Curtobacterium sp. MCBD17_003]
MSNETVDGVPVTDAMVEAWATEAEAGYPLEQLRRRGRRPVGDGPGTVVPVRMDAALLQALTQRAEHDHLSRSEVIRAAVHAWIDAA